MCARACVCVCVCVCVCSCMCVLQEELAKDIVQEHFIKRLGTTEEVAAAVMYFASDESAFTTAADLVVDGGYLAH